MNAQGESMKGSKFDGLIKNITVAEVSSKLVSNGAKLIKLTDTEGKSYSFFSTKQVYENDKPTGQTVPSKAFEVFESLGDPVGKVLEIGYVEEPSKDDASIKFKKIRFMSEVLPDGNYSVDTSPNAGKIPTINHDIVVEDDSIPF